MSRQRFREIPIIGIVSAGLPLYAQQKDGLVLCEPLQYAENGEIVVALIEYEEAK
ncbi:MAG: hypothetical protein KKB30_01770 [Proteobacteria bacterium]|nr:hypothetical protein [Pseudomonadota bacterium]MBU1715541.1 hypothetical protein [Pseudomonadota bacterium]